MSRSLCWLLCVIALVVATGPVSWARPTIDLQGAWRVALDRDDVGVDEEWFTRELTDPIQLPGALRDSGYGDEITAETEWMSRLHDAQWYLRKEFKPYAQPGNVKVPFWLQPERKYTGVAWYQREITIPNSWRGRRCVVSFERAHWATMLWLDDTMVGYNDSLGTPHIYDLGILGPGTHRVTVRVDNRYLVPIRKDAHAITDSTQSNWHGLAGALTLTATCPIWIDDVRVFTDIRRKALRVEVQLGNATGVSGQGMLRVGGKSLPIKWDPDGAQTEVEVMLGSNARLWDEFNPALHEVTVKLETPYGTDQRELTVGLREIKSEDAKFTINGRRMFFRGTHEGCTFPLTGYPPTDVTSWKKVFAVCKDYGLNHMRFHSWCPPEAAFVAADEMGLYLQPECSNWGQYSSRDNVMKDFLYRETDAIVKAYGNHPSFVMLSSGNEPAGPWQAILTPWLIEWKEKDNRRIYASQTGRFYGNRPGPVDDIDYLIAIRIGMMRFRGDSGWFGRDYRASLEGTNYPVISHETGQWCAYPDFREMSKYTGALKPKNFEIFRDSLAAHGMLEQAHDFMMASGRLQLECYKQEIEGLLRTPGMGGFQLLDLHDFPGQGTALVGPLNVFWESKGYVTPAQFRRFCNVTVPLARMDKLIYTTADDLKVDFEIAHFGRAPLEGVVPVMKIVDAQGKVVVSGDLPRTNVPFGTAIPLKGMSANLGAFKAPQKYRLVLGLGGFADIENDWEFWVYPADVSTRPPADVLVTRSFSAAEKRLVAGGKVLFMPTYNQLSWDSPPVGRLPIFWNRLMGPGWERFLGLLCDPNHPALAEFVTDGYYDWQWQDVIRPYCRAVNLDRLPGTLKPIVQMIDDWNRNYKLGLVFECRVGDGKLMVCSADLSSDLSERPVARQLRHSLLSYMGSAVFDPTVEVTIAQIESVLFDNQVMQHLGAVAEATGDAGRRNGPDQAIDGNPNTYWLVGGGRDREDKHPCELTVRFERDVAMTGVICMARQNERAHEGDIREFALDVSEDGQQWREVMRGELESTFEPQKVLFGKTVTGRYLKLRALSGFADDPACALAELAVLGPDDSMAVGPAGVGGYKDVKTATEEIEGP